MLYRRLFLKDGCRSRFQQFKLLQLGYLSPHMMKHPAKLPCVFTQAAKNIICLWRKYDLQDGWLIWSHSAWKKPKRWAYTNNKEKKQWGYRRPRQQRLDSPHFHGHRAQTESRLYSTSSGSWTAVALRWAAGLGCIVCAPHSLAESRRDLLGCLARPVCVAAQQALPAGGQLSHHSCTFTITAGAAGERADREKTH